MRDNRLFCSHNSKTIVVCVLENNLQLCADLNSILRYILRWLYIEALRKQTIRLAFDLVVIGLTPTMKSIIYLKPLYKKLSVCFTQHKKGTTEIGRRPTSDEHIDDNEFL